MRHFHRPRDFEDVCCFDDCPNCTVGKQEAADPTKRCGLTTCPCTRINSEMVRSMQSSKVQVLLNFGYTDHSFHRDVALCH